MYYYRSTGNIQQHGNHIKDEVYTDLHNDIISSNLDIYEAVNKKRDARKVSIGLLGICCREYKHGGSDWPL